MPRNHKSTINPSQLTPLERLQRSRIQLLVNHPFFGQLAMYLQFVEQPDVGTAGTDGKHYFYNPEFIMSLSEKELNFLTAHEVLHPALGHLWRCGSRDRLLFNCAADFVINAMIKEVDPNETFFQMPRIGLFHEKFARMSTEQVYETLEKKLKSTKLVAGSRLLDNHEMWDLREEKSESTGEDLWKERLIQAANGAKGRGDLPSQIARMMQNLIAPQKNWRQLLAEFIELEVNDYGFVPPDKRLIHQDIYLPDWTDCEERVRNLVFAVDTSGSISDQEFQIFLSEIVGCINQFGGQITGKLIYCDAKIAKNGVYDLENVAQSLPVGGGGTDFRPVFEWIEENMRNQCAGLVYLTDGEGIFPKHEPSYPVLWILTHNSTKPPITEKAPVPFGQHAFLSITKTSY